MMKFILNPSLEHMALVKIVVNLWNQDDVRALIVKLGPRSFFTFSWRNDKLYDVEWEKIEDRVKEKVPLLSLPQLLKDKLFGVIKPIGKQISKWMESHCTYLHIAIPVKFCWTPQGTINKKKTAEMLIRDENLDMSTCYILACMYCFEKDIIHFWNSMYGYQKASILNSYLPYIVDIWSCDMQRRDSNSEHSNVYKFAYCAIDGFKDAAEYFLQKLTPIERQEFLVNIAKDVRDTDVLCFLLSKMNEEQQLEVLKNNLFSILQSFLQWPFQSFFIEIANCMWDFLSKDQYGDLLWIIIDKVNLHYKDWNYQEIFREFWQKSPDALKSFINGELGGEDLLLFLFHFKDKENMRLILESTTLDVKKKIIYSDKMKPFFQSKIWGNEWDFLKLFIRECLPSKNEMLKFKEEFERCIMGDKVGDYLERNMQKWEQLFCLSDDFTCKYSKRNVEKNESSSSKRLHCLQ